MIVSLTSYGERIAELKYTLYSLITQTVLPEKIVVFVSEDDFDTLPADMHFFEKYAVFFCIYENLKSYTKLIPALRQYPDKIIVTADDDIFYKQNWLKKLYNDHLKHPDEIICHQVYKIKTAGNKIAPYNRWEHNVKVYNDSRKNFLMGVGGVLYPPCSLFRDTCDSSKFKKLAPYADDIWFYFMAILQGTKIRQAKKADVAQQYVNPYREYGIASGATLGQINVQQNKNDEQFRAVLAHYKVSEQEFIAYIEGKAKSLR